MTEHFEHIHPNDPSNHYYFYELDSLEQLPGKQMRIVRTLLLQTEYSEDERLGGQPAETLLPDGDPFPQGGDIRRNIKPSNYHGNLKNITLTVEPNLSHERVRSDYLHGKGTSQMTVYQAIGCTIIAEIASLSGKGRGGFQRQLLYYTSRQPLGGLASLASARYSGDFPVRRKILPAVWDEDATYEQHIAALQAAAGRRARGKK